MAKNKRTAAVVRINRPDISPRALARYNRQASDAALDHLQQHFLPRHFKRSAVQHYPDEYNKTVYLRRRTGDDSRTDNRIPLPRFLQIIRTKQPLVKTGLTRQIALHGEHKKSGRSDRRSLTLTGLPRYFFFTRNLAPGRFHKVEALNAVSDAEAAELTDLLDAHVNKLLAASYRAPA